MAADLWKEKLPSKKLDRLLERHAVLQDQLLAQVAREYPVGSVCQFRHDGMTPQPIGRIVAVDALLCKVEAEFGVVCVDLYDVRRLRVGKSD